MKNKIIMAIDPSGNFKYNKGHTGIVVCNHGKIEPPFTIKAKEFKTREEYFNEILEAITHHNPSIVIIEEYKLQAGKALFQANKTPETNELITWLKTNLELSHKHYEVVMQSNSVKARWRNKLLRIELKDILNWKMPYTLNNHEKDALRHLINYWCKANGLFNT